MSQAVVLYAYQPTSSEQIAVDENAVVYVESAENADWWYVRRASDDAVGYVPASYVQISAVQMAVRSPEPEPELEPEGESELLASPPAGNKVGRSSSFAGATAAAKFGRRSPAKTPSFMATTSASRGEAASPRKSPRSSDGDDDASPGRRSFRSGAIAARGLVRSKSSASSGSPRKQILSPIVRSTSSMAAFGASPRSASSFGSPRSASFGSPSPRSGNGGAAALQAAVRFGRRSDMRPAPLQLVGDAGETLPSFMSPTGSSRSRRAKAGAAAVRAATRVQIGTHVHAALLKSPSGSPKARMVIMEDGDEQHESSEEEPEPEPEPEVDPETEAMLTNARALHGAVIMNDPAKIKHLLRPEQRSADMMAVTKKSLKNLQEVLIPKLENQQHEHMQKHLPAAREKKKVAVAWFETMKGKEALLVKQLKTQTARLEEMIKTASPEARAQANVAAQRRLVHDLEGREVEMRDEMTTAKLQSEQAEENAATAEREWLASIKRVKDAKERVKQAQGTLLQCKNQPRLLNWADPLGRTAAWIAADSGSMEVLEVLLEASADIETPGPGQRSCLQRACFHGHLEVVESLLNREIRRQVQATDEQGATAFFAACHEGHVEIAKLLAGRGASIDATASDGSSPLFVAAQNGHFPVVQFLVQRGADKDQARDGGFTPLYIACQHGHLDVVQYLLTGRLHASLGGDGGDAWNRNRQRRRGTIGRYLVEHEKMMWDAANFKGADPKLASVDGVSPACVAAHEGHDDVLEFLGKHDKTLLRMATRTGLTPLHCACVEGHVDAARVLSEHGVNLSQLDKNGFTPLRMAEKAGMTQAATFVYTKLHPAISDQQIAKQWKTKNDRNVMACHRKILQEKHIKEVKAKHKESLLARKRGAGSPRAKKTAGTSSPKKANLNTTQGSLMSPGASSVASSPEPLPAVLKALNEQGNGGPTPGKQALAKRRNAVTIAEYSGHILDAHSFDPAAAAAAEAAAAAAAKPAATKSLSFSLASPTGSGADMKSPMTRITGRRRGLVQTDSASEMFRAASLHQRSELLELEKGEAERTNVFARLTDDQASPSRRRRNGGVTDSPKEKVAATATSLKPLKMN